MSERYGALDAYLLAIVPILEVSFASVVYPFHGTGGYSEPAWWLLASFTLQVSVIGLSARRRYLVWSDGEFKPARPDSGNCPS